MGIGFRMSHTDKAPEQPTSQPEQMQRCANTPQESFQNTSPGSWQLSSCSSLCCSGELLQEGCLQEQEVGLPGLKD